jgi:hypothetical protein
VSSKDRQIQALQRRLQTERAEHRQTLNAKNTELRALRDAWELFDTYPQLQNLLVWLHKIRDAAGPLRSPTFQPGHSADTVTAAERGAFPDRDRNRLSYINRKIEGWVEVLEAELSPKGRLVDDEIENTDPRPRCHNTQCPARLIPQAFDQEICYECKDAFTEHRPFTAKCWKTECAGKLQRSRGHLGACP